MTEKAPAVSRLKKRITRKQKVEFAETTALAALAKQNGHRFFHEQITAAALAIIMTDKPTGKGNP